MPKDESLICVMCVYFYERKIKKKKKKLNNQEKKGWKNAEFP